MSPATEFSRVPYMYAGKNLSLGSLATADFPKNLSLSSDPVRS